VRTPQIVVFDMNIHDSFITLGDLLAVETPFVWLLDKEESRTHCWHCFRSGKEMSQFLYIFQQVLIIFMAWVT